MPAGGRRPGAGAPIGNTNPHKAVALATALKSGRHSARFKAVLTAMSQVPEVRDYFALVRRQTAPHQAHGRRGEMHKALLEVLQRAPTRSNPLLAYLRKTPPCANRPSFKRPGRKSIKVRINPTA